ncbi:DUF742 domain-containing protein [Streptomyces sp. NPDC005953]|uniref:DUF742 domain-containing protein n=1 Tax=Streptomyces sp. NPDC005953 TaxID=3156719 RepID=UPI00340BBDEC
MPGPRSRLPWVEDDTAPLRPYALTRGRTRPTHDLQRDTLVQANKPLNSPSLDEEQTHLIALCAEWTSIAELSGLLRLPVQIVKVLAGDLIDVQLLVLARTHHPSPATDYALLEQVLAGLHQL